MPGGIALHSFVRQRRAGDVLAQLFQPLAGSTDAARCSQARCNLSSATKHAVFRNHTCASGRRPTRRPSGLRQRTTGDRADARSTLDCAVSAGRDARARTAAVRWRRLILEDGFLFGDGASLVGTAVLATGELAQLFEHVVLAHFEQFAGQLLANQTQARRAKYSCSPIRRIISSKRARSS